MNKLLKLFVLLILLGVSIISITPVANGAVIELPNQYQAPKMITMSLYEDSSKMAFNYNTDWETDTVLQIVKDGMQFNSENIIEYIGTTEKSKVLNDGFIHRVVATNLESGEKYLYRLGDKELNNWSDIGSFSTADNSDSLKFIHISDPQGYELLHYENYNELLLKAMENSNPDFIAITGDIVNDSYADATPKLEQWSWALTMQKEVLMNVPVVACAGNHEASNYDFNSRFNFSVVDETMTNGSYYSFDYNNVHFSVLNTNDTLYGGLSVNQIKWLENDLKDNSNKKFKIVMMHKGIYDAGGHCSNLEGQDADIKSIREQLTPIFDRYNVDLVLQGHDHLYSRSYPIGSNEELISPIAYKDTLKINKEYNGLTYSLFNNPKGTIYLNSGTASGSKYYAVVNFDSNLIPIEVSDSSSERIYTEIVIEGDNLYATVYKLKNKELFVFDTFGISKGNNESDNSNQETIENNNTQDSFVNNLKDHLTEILIISISICAIIIGVVVTVLIKKKRGDNR